MLILSSIDRSNQLACESIGISIVPINFDRHNNHMKGIDDEHATDVVGGCDGGDAGICGGWHQGW